jgi:RNA polymerase sigma-70 factor (ECF subfamily)
MSEASAEALLHRVVLGDHAALGALYDRYAALAHGLALRIVRDAAEAQDVVQEVFVQVWRQAARYDPARGNPEAWVCTIARSRALDRVRRRAARREEPQRSVVSSTAPAPDDALAVRSALRALSEEQRQALELAYFEGLTQSEIAHRLGEPLGTVKSRIRAGMMRLRETLA